MSEPKKRGRKPHTEEQRKAAMVKKIDSYGSVNMPKSAHAKVTQARTVLQHKIANLAGVPNLTITKGQALTAIVEEWLATNDPTGELRKGDNNE